MARSNCPMTSFDATVKVFNQRRGNASRRWWEAQDLAGDKRWTGRWEKKAESKKEKE